ncbi:MAG: glycosyltransferase [Chitinophagales bacterium]|nr:glycosyltransferase [Chitinophagales bacterium]
MPNVLYLSYDGMTDPLGQSQVLPYLQGLTKCEIKFTLVSFEKKANFEKNKIKIELICHSAGIEWIPLKYTKTPPVLSTVWDYFKMLHIAKKVTKKKNIQLVHCRSYISSLVGLRLKKKSGVRFLFDMRGFWADERVDGNLWNLRNPVYKFVYKFFKNKEREFLTLSDIVVSLTNAGKEEMLRWNIPGLTHDKIKVIPCAADFELFTPTNANLKRLAKESLGFQNNFVLSYIGSIGTWYLLDEMIVFFSVLKRKIPEAKFLILTPDSPESIQRIATKYEIDPTDIYIRFAERKALPALAHSSDFNIFFIKPAYSKISSSPTKMGEILAMGIPILCNDKVGDVEDIIVQTHAGFCIDSFDQATFEKAADIIKGKHDYDGTTIRENARKIFDLSSGVNAYRDIYQSIL